METNVPNSSSSSLMSPVTIVLLVVIVILIAALGYMYFFGSSSDSAQDPVYDSDTCAAFTSVTSNVKPANMTSCAALGYSSASSAAPITVTTAFCSNLSANVALFASNVAAYYTKLPLLKKDPPGPIVAASTYYGGSATVPATYSVTDVTTWATESLLYGRTGGPSFPEDFTKIISDSGLLFSTRMTTELPVILTVILAPRTVTGYTPPADLWINEVTDTDGNVWHKLDTTKVAAAVISGIKTMLVPGNDYVNYCA